MKGKTLWLLLLSLSFNGGCSSASSRNKLGEEGRKMAQSARGTPNPEQKTPRPYSTKMDQLRAQFNRDKGKVRLLMLLSPT
jgi:hypothetical protein